MSECNREALVVRRPRSGRGCFVVEKKMRPCSLVVSDILEDLSAPVRKIEIWLILKTEVINNQST